MTEPRMRVGLRSFENAAAITTLVSRSAATGAASAFSSAARTSR